jgi:hypothetical protein
MRRNVAFLATAVVVVSAVVNVAHTASHAGQHLMSLPGWQLAYIAIVIYAAPLVAASLLWTQYRFAGAWLLAASMAGSFAFGLLYHFVIPGPDNVFTQPPGTWRTVFGVSAALLLPLQGAGCLVGLLAARASSRWVSDGGARPVGSPAGPRRTTGRSLPHPPSSGPKVRPLLLRHPAQGATGFRGPADADQRSTGLRWLLRGRKSPQRHHDRRSGGQSRAIRLVVNPEKLGGVLPLDRAEIVEGPR